MIAAPALSPHADAVEAQSASRIERWFARFGVMMLVAAAPAVILYLSFSNGGYFPPATGFAAILIAQALVLRTTLAERPFEGYTRRAGLALIALGLFALEELASALWSHDPARALDEYDRTLLYVLTFSLFASLPRSRLRLAGLTRALAAAMTLVCVAGLISRTLPHLWPTASGYFSERLSYPLGYWNALGTMAAIATVLLVHLASSLREQRAVRVLAATFAPATATTLLLTYSRASIAVVILALLVYAILGRPRGLLSALVALAPTIAIALGAAYDAVALSTTNPTSPVAVVQGRHVAVTVGICMLAAGLARAALLRLDRWLRHPHRLPEPIGRIPPRAIVAATSLAVVIVLVAAGAPAFVARQYDGFINVNSAPVARQVRDRLTDPASNGRLVLWHVALRAFRERPLLGQGAGTYAWYQPRYRTDDDTVTDAHSLYLETLGELGIVGFALLMVALLSVLISLAAGIRGPHRSLYAALFAAVLAWAVQAGVDWDWEMPAVTMWVFAVGGATLASPVAAKATTFLTAGPRNRVALALGWLVLAVAPLLGGVSYQRLGASAQALKSGDCAVARPKTLSSIGLLAVRPDAYEILGYCDLENGYPAESLQAMRKAVIYEKQNWSYHYGLAIALGANELDPRPEAEIARLLNPRGSLPRRALSAFAADSRAQWPRVARTIAQTALHSGSLSISGI